MNSVVSTDVLALFLTSILFLQIIIRTSRALQCVCEVRSSCYRNVLVHFITLLLPFQMGVMSGRSSLHPKVLCQCCVMDGLLGTGPFSHSSIAVPNGSDEWQIKPAPRDFMPIRLCRGWVIGNG